MTKRLSLILGLLLFSSSAYGVGGACPAGTTYLNAVTNTLTTLASFGVTSCFYASTSGSDANDGLSEASGHPWLHIPGMVGCSSVCASTTPAAGEGFILRGGDHWTGASLGVVWTWAGNSSHLIWLGVDSTWFTGSAWTRPIWDCGGTACSGTGNHVNYWFPAVSYVTLDNIEFTGLQTNGTGGNPSYVATQLDHDVVQNCYFHGWSISSGATQDFGIIASFNKNSFSPFTSLGSGLFYSVIDGSDTAKNSMEAVGGNPTYIVGNWMQDVTNELNSIGTSDVHDNWFGPVLTSFQAGAHQNAAALGGADNGQTNQFFYNNVITGSTCSVCGGVVKLWLDTYVAPVTNIGFAFNNVIFNNTNGNLINQGDGRAGATYWTWNFFNNTVECGTDASTGPCYSDAGAVAPSQATFHSENNFWISSTGTAVSCSVYTCTTQTDLLRSVAGAASAGYSSGTAFAFQPTIGSGPTVHAGTNAQTLCGTIAALNSAAGSACQHDTGYACHYNSANHSVSCPARTELARASSGAWDISAYNYSASTPAAPTQLQVIQLSSLWGGTP